jgi:hypothetical protein
MPETAPGTARRHDRVGTPHCSAGNAGGTNIQRLNTAILTPVTTPARFAAFNPFTTTPVRGVNYDLGPIFGLATNRFAWTTPQSVRILFGVRF